MSLIRVPEHRLEDLEAWTAVSAHDLAWTATTGFVRRVTEAQRELTRWLDEDRAPYISVSWGKDSVCLAHLAHLAPTDAELARVTYPHLDNPYSNLVRDAFLARWPFPYREVEVVTATPPVYREPHVLDQAWFEDVWTPAWGDALAELADYYDSYATGIRAQESRARRMRLARHGIATDVTCAPLSRWTAQDVWAYLAIHDLPVHPTYAMAYAGSLDRDWLRVDFLSLPVGQQGDRAQHEEDYLWRQEKDRDRERRAAR